jgi:hypothetical protein
MERDAAVHAPNFLALMKIQQLLDHHRILRNPFAEEDAQTDPVFKDHCIESTFHPTWDKVYGDPAEPSTAVVFGEKGSGKTAMRLQIARHLEEYNRAHPGQRDFVIHYDDFNPFLDRFHEHAGRRRRADKVLNRWHLWDHMDAVLQLGVTGLVDRILGVRHPSPATQGEIVSGDVDELDRHQARDLLLLAACYDQSTAETFKGRWHRLRKRLKFGTLLAQWDFALGIAVNVLVILLLVVLAANGQMWWWIGWWTWLWLLPILGGWVPYVWRLWKCFRLSRGVAHRMRTGNVQAASLRHALMHFSWPELAGQPLPNKDRTDDRYELLAKFQGILQSLGFTGIVVLVDRVDEPHLINGSSELMKALVWPMLDNKFLKHPGLGLKLMLPVELTRFIDREEREFYQRARLDKQNMVRSFEWTGEALFDVANARIAACAADGATPKLHDLFDESLGDRRLIESLRSLRVPRHLFKFLYRLLVAHAGAHTDSTPVWRISAETFESELAVYHREQDAFDRGLGAG